MNFKAAGLFLLLSVLFSSGAPAAENPSGQPDLVSLGNGVVGALYHPPSTGPKGAVAVYVMHAEGDYLRFSACTELSRRGYTVLCANNSASKMGMSNDLDFEQMMLDVSAGVRFLRGRPDVRKIVLFGHSGGGAMMSAYQNIAENGLAACQGPEKIVPCSDKLAGLPSADGLLLVDSNYGLSGMVLFSLDPAVTDETSGTTLDAALDLFAEKNGFSQTSANYSDTFKHTFLSAVAARMNHLIGKALEQKAAMAAGTGSFADDAPMTIPGGNYIGFNNKLFAQDPSLLAHTEKPWPLLHKNGSQTIEIVRSVRPPQNLKPTTGSYTLGALKTTVNRFLSTFAVRVESSFSIDEDSIQGVDWASSHTAPIAAASGVTVPLLTMGMTGHWEYLAAEKIYGNSGSKDKSIAFVEGASHVITPCKECETVPGEFGDTVTTTYDYIDQWLGRPGRFLP